MCHTSLVCWFFFNFISQSDCEFIIKKNYAKLFLNKIFIKKLNKKIINRIDEQTWGQWTQFTNLNHKKSFSLFPNFIYLCLAFSKEGIGFMKIFDFNVLCPPEPETQIFWKHDMAYCAYAVCVSIAYSNNFGMLPR